MDISPGSTPTDESRLENSVIHHSSNMNLTTPSTSHASAATATKSPATYTVSSAVRSEAGTPLSASVSNSTLLNTLASLQQAVLNIGPDKTSLASGNSATKPGTTSKQSFATCLSLLPALLGQLSEKQSSSSSQSDNQLIMQQGEIILIVSS